MYISKKFTFMVECHCSAAFLVRLGCFRRRRPQSVSGSSVGADTPASILAAVLARTGLCSRLWLRLRCRSHRFLLCGRSLLGRLVVRLGDVALVLFQQLVVTLLRIGDGANNMKALVASVWKEAVVSVWALAFRLVVPASRVVYKVTAIS